jgi:hypothetical protein
MPMPNSGISGISGSEIAAQPSNSEANAAV